MMPLLGFAFVVLFGVVASQNHDVNLQDPYKEMTRKRSVEATTVISPDPHVKDAGMLESLCMERLEYLITDTNRRFLSLENQSSEVHFNVNNLNKMFNKGLQELKDLQISTSCSPKLTLDNQYPRNCKEVQQSGKSASGTYMIQPENAQKPFHAVCDLETRGGGWTVIQRRFDGSQDFYLRWEMYKNGFGNLGGEFWIGLENIHLLTGFAVNELLIEIGDFHSENKSALYSEFSVGSEMEGYSLNVLGGYSGDAGDSLQYNIGEKFTTKDKDQDNDPHRNLALVFNGAWWYCNTDYSNLNGMYLDGDQVPNYYVNRTFWYTFHGHYNLKHTRMLVRPKV